MTSNDRERAEDEAADWLILLAEEPDDAELRAGFESWRTAAPLHAEIWERTARAYDLVGQGQPVHRAAWESHVATANPPRDLPPLRARSHERAGRRGGSRRPRWIAGLAGAAIAAAMAVVVLPGVLLTLQADYSTPRGEARMVALADGSRVRLAPGSALAVDLAGRERKVRLLSGEAWFDVARDPARPFKVAAPDAEVTVLGTAFDVAEQGGGTSVAVGRGHVRVRSARNGAVEDLHPGDRVLVSPSGAMAGGRVAIDEVGGRSEGLLAVRNRPAAEVIEALRPWYKGVIVVRAPSLSRWRVSGLYDLRDTQGTLGTLAGQHGATIRRFTPWLTVVTGE